MKTNIGKSMLKTVKSPETVVERWRMTIYIEFENEVFTMNEKQLPRIRFQITSLRSQMYYCYHPL
jgi:hypothetical protein